MNEIWKDIKGYEGYYQVSNFGNVRSVRKNRLMALNVDRGGYYRINLCVHQKYKRVAIHRLVAEAFIPNPDNLPVINHKDENKINNRVNNLEWCTVKYNNTYGDKVQRGVETFKKHRLQKQGDN